MPRLVESVARDLAVLQAAGVDGPALLQREGLPYQLAVGPEIAAGLAAVIGAVRDRIRVPFGVNLLWDPIASLAVARATGARFIREVLTGVYESDLGIMQPDIGAIAAYRSDRRLRRRPVRQHLAGVHQPARVRAPSPIAPAARRSSAWTRS